MFDSIFQTFYLFTRSLLKWFLHKYTSLCELQRIVYGCLPGAKRTKLVESSLELSKQPRIKQMLIIFDRLVASSFISDQVFKHDITEVAVHTVLAVKKVSPKIHPNFSRGFGGCVEKIWSYKLLNHTIEELRSTPYDSCNFEHEGKLMELWQLLNPNGPELEDRISKQWQDIGFQGDDPKTDFRGMGMLGLENLLYFAKTPLAKHVLSHSLHPVHGYTFAIVGINLTAFATRLLKTNLAKTHFYNLKRAPTLDEFHKFYCYLFFEFDRLWMDQKPTSIMDFSHIFREIFETNILSALDQEACLFKLNAVVESV